MPVFDQFAEDQVVLLCNGQTMKLSKGYEVRASVLDQPGQFSIDVGHAGMFADLIRKFPPKSAFTLQVNDLDWMSGEIDDHSGKGPHTQLDIGGRDPIARLIDNSIYPQVTFKESTYTDLVQTAMDDVGLATSLYPSNDANRKAVTGKNEIQVETTVELNRATEAGEEAEPDKVIQKLKVYKKIEAKVGESWWDFLKNQLDRAGLCLWASADGGLVISPPNANQAPIYRIFRKLDENGQLVKSNVVSHDYRNNTSGRKSECIVTGKAGGGKQGHGQVEGRFIDTEMVQYLNPDPADQGYGGLRKCRLLRRDDKAKTIEQCNYLARRIIAEINRNQMALAYTVAGHSTMALSGSARIVWSPDTVVEVDDDVLQIHRNFYIPTVELKRKPHTTSVLHLMRNEDMVIGTKLSETEPSEDEGN
ncbi:MAG TPA: hypothetical protein VHO25_07175 [Polyangiaceae bacterium]|nr:hypothetical protein [Polyangiaceae bacterium]